METLGKLIIVIILLSISYLFATAIVYIIFTLISIGGYDIEFNVWIGGLLLLIIGGLFKK